MCGYNYAIVNRYYIACSMMIEYCRESLGLLVGLRRRLGWPYHLELQNACDLSGLTGVFHFLNAGANNAITQNQLRDACEANAQCLFLVVFSSVAICCTFPVVLILEVTEVFVPQRMILFKLMLYLFVARLLLEHV